MIFRPGTVDAACWAGIVDHNEYRLPPVLPADSLIVDIGTHVGSFVKAAHDRGARRIISYEADLGNFVVARENVGSLDGVTLVNSAVGRSDDKAQEFVRFGGYVPFFDGSTNTGGGNVFASDGAMVHCIPFDRIESGADIFMLKIDCEGSEWPILLTSDLSRVRTIVGEYHSLPDKTMDELGLPRFSKYGSAPAYMEAVLRDLGFPFVRVEPFNELHAQMHDGQQIGLFSASR